jgi:hypothetical protein
MTRRRLLIALTATACVSYAVWWTFWRGDPRFVGRWRIVDHVGGENRGLIDFHANATGRRGRTGYEFDWWVDGECIVLYEETTAPPISTFDLRRKVNHLYALLLGYSRRGTERRLRFKQIEEGRMRVWQVDDENAALGHVYEIVRVEE